MKNNKSPKVYVLMGGCIDDRNPVSVFSSLKKAEDARNWLIENDTFYKGNPDCLSIEPFYLNGEHVGAW